jgi:TRAP-type C4-dicarboxylate transport system substrate-binding protein
MKRSRNGIISLAGALIIVLALPALAMSADVIKLTHASLYGSDHVLSRADKLWIEKIEKETNGRVHITAYWGGALFPLADAIDEMVLGTADIGVVSPVRARMGFEITKAAPYFFLGANQQNGAHIAREWRAKFPELQKEYKGLKVVAWGGGLTYQLLSRVPIRKVEDLKGLRIGCMAAEAEVYRSLGADPQIVGAGDFYVQMQKSMLDVGCSPVQVMSAFKLYEVAKYVTLINFYNVPNGNRVMNINSYNKLPTDVRKVFDDNIEFWGNAEDSMLQNEDQAGAALAKKNGVEFITLPKAELDKFYKPWRAHGLSKAKELDAKGLPGTKMLQEAERLTQANSK